MKKFWIIAVLFAFVAGFGCKEKTPEEATKEILKDVKVPETADAVVVEAVKIAKAGEFYKLMAFLPDSYQKDINEIFTILATIDPEIYNKGAAILAKGLDVAVAKKDDLLKLAGPMGAMVPPDAAEIVKAVKNALDKGGLLKHETFKNFSIVSFLKDHGKTLFDMGAKNEQAKAGLAMLDTIKAKLDKAEGDKATVIVTTPDGDMPVVFVKVENKWIPEDLAKDWAKDVAKMKEELKKAVADINKDKEKIMALLTNVEKGLADFEKNGDPNALMGAVMGGGAAPAPEAAPAPAGEAPAPAPAQ